MAIARGTLDVKEREDSYREAWRLPAQKLPYCLVWADTAIVAHSKQRRGPIEDESFEYL